MLERKQLVSNLCPRQVASRTTFLYLFQASLDAAVFAGDHLAVPVVCGPAGHAQVWVTLPHGQVAGTLFGVTLSLAPAAWETVLAWKSFRHRAA